MPQNNKSIVVLLSGHGSTLQALLDQQQTYGYAITGVISNRPAAYGLERAHRANVPAIVVDHQVFATREAHDEALAAQVARCKPDWVVLAGYLRLLTPAFVRRFRDRLINIHPSLLPAYKGLHTHQRVLAAGEHRHGTTVHCVTDALDSGAILLQAALTIQPDDTEQSLRQRVQRMEQVVYPLVVGLLVSGRLTITTASIRLDNKPLGPQGYQLEESALNQPIPTE